MALVRCLRAKEYLIDQMAFGVAEGNGFARCIEAEGRMNRTEGFGLIGFIVGPYQEESLCGDDRVFGEGPWPGIGWIVSEGVAIQVDGFPAWIVELDPVLKISIRGIGEAGLVVGHPLVDPDLRARKGSVPLVANGMLRSEGVHGTARAVDSLDDQWLERLAEGILKPPVGDVGPFDGFGNPVELEMMDFDRSGAGDVQDGIAGHDGLSGEVRLKAPRKIVELFADKLPPRAHK